MAGKVVPAPPAEPFEYELVEDEERLRNEVESSSQSRFWIDPSTLKLRQRIGRGPFGDVYIATHRLPSNDDYCEVAVKMLQPVREDQVKILLEKFESLFSACQGLEGVCVFYGVSFMHGKICILMKLYETSVADKIAQLKEGRLMLPEVLAHGINLARAISELHAREILILNLKCSNILLDESNQAIVGDIGVPYILLGVPLLSLETSRRFGSPNYMAPEQWRPDVRGPISFETDTWGFGCCIVEMLSGVQPWSGKTLDEIYDSVVVNRMKPEIPAGIPPPVETILMGCFEYDFRNRPLMRDVIRVFKSCDITVDVSSEWATMKDELIVGDTVRSRKNSNSRKQENMCVPEGDIVGLEREDDQNEFALVKVHGVHDPLRVPTSSLERVSFGLSAGDWVRLKEQDKKLSPVGILHSIGRTGEVTIGFIGLETLWKGRSSDLQMAEAYFVGEFVKVKGNILSPRYEWPKRGGIWAAGKVVCVHGNGCLVVKFPGRLHGNGEFLADPSEVETVSFSSCKGIVGKYRHLEDFHWAVRPILVAFGLFAALKLGCMVGRTLGRTKKNKQVSGNEGTNGDGQVSNWLPPPVANILGVSSSK